MKAISLFLLLLAASVRVGAASLPYPAPCFVDGVPYASEGDPLVRTGFIQLDQTASATYQVYRKACRGGGAAILVRFIYTDPFLYHAPAPAITVIQGATTGPLYYSKDPYPRSFPIRPGDMMDRNPAYILDTSGFDATKAVSLLVQGSTSVQVELPDFDPSQYPDSMKPVPIRGYLSGSYYSPAHSGEGILVEVNPTGGIFAAMFTYDDAGKPLWLVAQTAGCGWEGCWLESQEGDLLVSSGGGFAGTTDPTKTTRKKWGKIAFTWPTCTSLKMTLEATHGDPALPRATKELLWNRLTDIGDAVCRGG